MTAKRTRKMTVSKTTWTPDERTALLDRATWQGDASALPELRAMLDAHPDEVRWFTAYQLSPVHPILAAGNFEQGQQEAMREILIRRVSQMREELASANPSRLEHLLCERIAACWLALSMLEASTLAGPNGGPASTTAQEHHDRMISRAHKRYLEACESLAKVRRLLRPIAAQVNIATEGANQLNVAGVPEGIALPSATGE